MYTKKFFCCSSIWKYLDLGPNRWVEWKVKVIYLLDWCSKCKQCLGPDAAQLADIMCHTKCRQCYWAPAVKIYNDLVFKATSQPMQFLGKKQKNVKCLSIGQKILSDYWHLNSYEWGKEPCAVSSWPWAIPPTHQKDLVSCLWWSEFSLRDCKKKGFLPRKGRTFFRTTYVL